jgi:hypothetical protein
MVQNIIKLAGTKCAFPRRKYLNDIAPFEDVPNYQLATKIVFQPKGKTFNFLWSWRIKSGMAIFAVEWKKIPITLDGEHISVPDNLGIYSLAKFILSFFGGCWSFLGKERPKMKNVKFRMVK